MRNDQPTNQDPKPDDSKLDPDERNLSPCDVAVERLPWCVLRWNDGFDDPYDPDIIGPFATSEEANTWVETDPGSNEALCQVRCMITPEFETLCRLECEEYEAWKQGQTTEEAH